MNAIPINQGCTVEYKDKERYGLNYFSGIIHRPERLQPYTVWWKGRVVWFTDDKEVAELKLKVEEARRK